VSVRELITEHLDLWAGAVTKKSSSGRGNNGKVELTGVKKLRDLILQLAVTGRLVEQDASEEPATDLINRIQAGKEQLSLSSKQRKAKPLPPLSESERPFSLPPGWALSRLNDITDIQGGIAKGKKVAGRQTRKLPYLRVANVQRSSLDLSEIKEIEIAEEEIERYLVRQRDLLITEGGDWDKVGRTAIWDGRLEPMAHQNHVFRARLILREQNEQWLERYLNSRFARDYFAGSSKQTTNLASINKTQLRSCTVPLPPLEEQHRIVQKVDELMALCDRLEQQTSDQLEAHETLVDTLIGTLTQSENATELADNWARLAVHFDTLFTTEQSIDKLKQTILQLAVMGRLVEQDAGDEPACELLNRIAQEKIRLVAARKLKKQKPLTEIGDEDKPFELPSGWHWARFGDVCAIKGELVRPESFPDLRQVAPDCIEKGTGRITENRTVKESGVKGPNSRFYAGQIVYSKIRPSLSKAALVDFDGLCSADMYPIDAFIDSRFLLMEILSEIFLQQVRVAENRIKMPKLNQESLTGFVLPIPPLTEQHRIVQKVDELMALCDQLKERLNQASETRCQLAEAVADNALN